MKFIKLKTCTFLLLFVLNSINSFAQVLSQKELRGYAHASSTEEASVNVDYCEDYSIVEYVPEILFDMPALKEVGIDGKRLDLEAVLEKIASIETIEELNLTSLKDLKTMPSVITKIKNLQRLTLTCNPDLDCQQLYRTLSKLPKLHELTIYEIGSTQALKGIEQLEHLKVLSIPFIGAKRFNWEKAMGYLSKLPCLENLDIEEGAFQAIPKNIGRLKNLKQIRASSSGLDLFLSVERLAMLPKLESLIFEDNRLEKIPSNIGKLKNLRVLYFNSGELDELPEVIGNLTNLEELYLYDNKLKTLPKSIHKLKKLRVLELSDNPLEFLPNSFSELESLKSLEISEVLDVNEILEVVLSVPSLENLTLYNVDTNLLVSAAYKNLKSLDLSFDKEVNWKKNWEWILQFEGLVDLDISAENLEYLPEEISVLSKLEGLMLNYNDLKSLPESIGDLKALRALELKGNALEVLPSSLCKLGALELLQLERNDLENIPNDWTKMSLLRALYLSSNELDLDYLVLPKGLEYLDLSNNNIIQMSANWKALENLKFLSIASNNIESLGNIEMSNLPNLIYLNLNMNKLSSLPATLFDGSLVGLDLAYNKLKTLPEAQNANRQLKYLDVSGNGEFAFPKHINKLENLAFLNARNSLGEKLPIEFGELAHLEEVDFSAMNLAKLPSSFKNLRSLKKITADNYSVFNDSTNFVLLGELAQLEFFKASIMKRYLKKNTLSKLKHLKVLDITTEAAPDLELLFEELASCQKLIALDLSFSYLSHLPENISLLSNLEYLELDYNKLQKLPESIGKLSKLKELDISNNKINELPENIGNLSNLGFLKVDENLLTELPKNIGNLKKLKELSLKGNGLAELPDNFCNLKALLQLDLTGNKLQELPNKFHHIKKLQRLKLGKNQFTVFPKVITKLYSLQNLGLEDNQLQDLASSLSNLSGLYFLSIGGNKFTKEDEEKIVKQFSKIGYIAF